MKKFLVFLLMFCTLFKVNALNDWVKVEEKKDTILENKLNEYINNLNQFIEKLKKNDKNYDYRYTYKTTNKKEKRNIIINKLFDSLNDAINYYNNINSKTKENKKIEKITLENDLPKEIEEKNIICKSDCNDEINNLNKDNYKLITTITKIYQKIRINKTFDDLNKASSELEKIKNNGGNGEIIKKRNSKDITTTTSSDKLTYEEALELQKKLTNKTDDGESKATIREEKETIKGDTVNIEDVVKESFETLKDAENKVKQLEKEGYIVSKTIKQVAYVENNSNNNNDNNDKNNNNKKTYNHLDITLLNKANIIKDNKTREVNINMTVSSLKVNGKIINIKGPSIDPNTNFLEYESTNRKLKIQNNSIVTIEGVITYKINGNKFKKNYIISGNLDDALNVCGGNGSSKGFDLKYNSITIDNDNVYIDANIKTKYIITGTMYKMENKSNFYIDTKTTKYGFDYILNATDNQLVNQLSYYYTYTEKNNKYKLSYDDYDNYIDISYTIEKQQNKDNASTVSIPNTGVQPLSILIFIIPLAIFLSLKLRKN